MELKVLIVEDDLVVADVLKEGLLMVCEKEDCKISIEILPDGEFVLNRHQEMCFDLLIIDLCLPKTKGMEIIKKIREQDNVVALIVITGKPTLETAIEAIQYKVFAYMTKPFAISELVYNAQNAVAFSILKKKILGLAEQAKQVLKRNHHG